MNGRQKSVVNKTQWDKFQESFNLSDEEMNSQYILDKKVMKNTESEQLRQKIELIFDELHCDWFTAPTKEIEKLVALFQSHEAQIKQDIFKKVEGLIGKKETLPNMTATPYLWAERNARNYLRSELRSSLKALEEKEIK